MISVRLWQFWLAALLLLACSFFVPIASAQEKIHPGCDEKSSDVLLHFIQTLGGMNISSASNLKMNGTNRITIKQEGDDDIGFVRNVELLIIGKWSHRHSLRDDDTASATICDGRTTWKSEPDAPFSKLDDPPIPDVIPWPQIVLNWEESNQIRFDGEETIEDRKCWKLQFTHIDGKQSLRFFDQETGQLALIRYTVEKYDLDIEANFEFEELEGVLLPLTSGTKIYKGGKLIQTSIQELTVEASGFQQGGEFTIPDPNH